MPVSASDARPACVLVRSARRILGHTTRGMPACVCDLPVSSRVISLSCRARTTRERERERERRERNLCLNLRWPWKGPIVRKKPSYSSVEESSVKEASVNGRRNLAESSLHRSSGLAKRPFGRCFRDVSKILGSSGIGSQVPKPSTESTSTGTLATWCRLCEGFGVNGVSKRRFGGGLLKSAGRGCGSWGGRSGVCRFCGVPSFGFGVMKSNGRGWGSTGGKPNRCRRCDILGSDSIFIRWLRFTRWASDLRFFRTMATMEMMPNTASALLLLWWALWARFERGKRRRKTHTHTQTHTHTHTAWLAYAIVHSPK